MARTCTICSHPGRQSIDQALVTGTSKRDVSALFRVSEDAITRHAAAHLPQALSKAQDAAEVAHADDLLGQLKDLQGRTLGILTQAEEAKDLRTALQAVGQARGNLELLAKVTGELAQEGTVQLVVSPEWIMLRAALLGALVPYPEARLAVAGRLAALEAV